VKISSSAALFNSFWVMITFWIHLISGLPGVQAASLEGFAGQDEVARVRGIVNYAT